MNTIAKRLQQVQNQILNAEHQYHRTPGSVTLIAVSKSQSVSNILDAYSAGQRQFAENYLQESLPKIAAIKKSDITWHFIGAIQSNKTNDIATHFDWVQSVDRLKIATLLSKARSPEKPPLQICLQVNVNLEPSKAGIPINNPLALSQLAIVVAKLPNLQLRGLLCIPAFSESHEIQRQNFAFCWQTFTMLKNDLPFLDTLSMGMSGDLESAIAEQSTMVRIGTAIFGPRDINKV